MTELNDAMVEAAAKAMYESEYDAESYPWTTAEQYSYRVMAKAALTAALALLPEAEQGWQKIDDSTDRDNVGQKGMSERALQGRLHHALTTAQNDDLSGPGTQERTRHCERHEAIRDAIAALDAKSALLVEAVTALEPFAEWIESRDANHASAGYPDACPLAFSPDRKNQGAATIGDLRRAAVLLPKLKAAQSGEG